MVLEQDIKVFDNIQSPNNSASYRLRVGLISYPSLFRHCIQSLVHFTATDICQQIGWHNCAENHIFRLIIH